jgi:hypothetical protein
MHHSHPRIRCGKHTTTPMRDQTGGAAIVAGASGGARDALSANHNR